MPDAAQPMETLDRPSPTSTDSPDDEQIEEVFVTGNIPAFVFALAGGVLIPDYADPVGNELVLLAMLNANSSPGAQPLLALPGIEQIFRLIGAPISVTGRDGATRHSPEQLPRGLPRLCFSHNGRHTRIGDRITAARNPLWVVCNKSDVDRLTYVAIATAGFRRFSKSWSTPTHLASKDANLGANMHHQTSRDAHSAVPCGLYVQGASNADSCLHCGLSYRLHHHREQVESTNLVEEQLRMLNQAFTGRLTSPPSVQHPLSPHTSDVPAKQSASPQYSISSDLRSSFSPNRNSSLTSGQSHHTLVAHTAHRLLTWSKFKYDDWVLVRNAAKLANATNTADHQRNHLSEDMNSVLSAYCDKYSGNIADKSLKGIAFRNLNEKPLDVWITTVDYMMRDLFNIPEFDKLDLDLKKDEQGRPALDDWRASWIIFERQENYYKEEARLSLLRDSIEKNFKELSDDCLQNEYKKWRRECPGLLDAVFAVCDILQPYTGKIVSLGKTGGSLKPGFKKFYCKNCKANDTHDTANCRSKDSVKVRKTEQPKDTSTCSFCKTADHTTANCTKKECPHCKKSGHKPDDCFQKPGAKVPASYICRKCNKTGHFVQNCTAAAKK